MIKIDYEGAWKKLKKTIEHHISPTDIYKTLLLYMNELERKHTYNYLDIKLRSNIEINKYWSRKYILLNEKYIKLKNKIIDNKVDKLLKRSK